MVSLKTLLRALAMLTACSPLSISSSLAQTEQFSFALIGDLGYVPAEEPLVVNLLADLAKHPELAFVVHVGDLSTPRYACTNEHQDLRLKQFNSLPQPLIFTPGDNEWVDCHPGQGIQGFDPFERLSRIRKNFFPDDRTLGARRMSVMRQSANPKFSTFVENARWVQGGVTFLTVHATGSNNNLGRTPEGDAEHSERNAANIAWLRESFELAKTNGSRAVMVLTQANIFPDFPPYPGKPQKPNGTAEMQSALHEEATRFAGKVVIVHGDSHYFRIDNPFRAPRVQGVRPPPTPSNTMRVETFGTPDHHWLMVTVDPSEANVFTFRPRIVDANALK